MVYYSFIISYWGYIGIVYYRCIINGHYRLVLRIHPLSIMHLSCGGGSLAFGIHGHLRSAATRLSAWEQGFRIQDLRVGIWNIGV